MGARVVIDKATLKRHRACRNAYSSPEWDKELDALVYEDWDVTLKRILSEGPSGLDEIEWLVAHKLVPMTDEEFLKIKKEYSHGV